MLNGPLLLLVAQHAFVELHSKRNWLKNLNKIHTIAKSNSYKAIIDKLLSRHGRIWIVVGELGMQKKKKTTNKFEKIHFFLVFYYILLNQKICLSLCPLPLLPFHLFYSIFPFHSPLLYSELCLLTDFGNWTIKKWIFDESFPTFSSSWLSLLWQRSCSPFTVEERSCSYRGTRKTFKPM